MRPSKAKIVRRGVQDDDDYRGVWVFIERNHGALNPASVELVEKARALASRLDTYVGAAIFGEYSSIAVAGLYSLGVNHVYAVDHETLDETTIATSVTRLITWLCSSNQRSCCSLQPA